MSKTKPIQLTLTTELGADSSHRWIGARFSKKSTLITFTDQKLTVDSVSIIDRTMLSELGVRAIGEALTWQILYTIIAKFPKRSNKTATIIIRNDIPTV